MWMAPKGNLTTCSKVWIHGGQNNVDLNRQANFNSKHNTYAAGQAKIQKRRKATNSSPGVTYFYVSSNPFFGRNLIRIHNFHIV